MPKVLLMTLLAPQWLVQEIGTISLILAAVILVMFSDFINRNIVFPIADGLKEKTKRGIRKGKKPLVGPKAAQSISEAMATFIFIFYCFLGSPLLAEYVLTPIFQKMRSFILIVVIVLFFAISFVINNIKVRRKFLRT